MKTRDRQRGRRWVKPIRKGNTKTVEENIKPKNSKKWKRNDYEFFLHMISCCNLCVDLRKPSWLWEKKKILDMHLHYMATIEIFFNNTTITQFTFITPTWLLNNWDSLRVLASKVSAICRSYEYSPFTPTHLSLCVELCLNSFGSCNVIGLFSFFLPSLGHQLNVKVTTHN